MQAEKERSLSLADIVQYFHLPLEEAAKQLRVCVATLKRSCRDHGIRSWPFRKLRAIKRRKAILSNGGRLTPSQQAVLQQCEESIAKLRTGALAQVEFIPTLDVANETSTPKQQTLCKPVHADSQCFLPTQLVDQNIWNTVLRHFHPW